MYENHNAKSYKELYETCSKEELASIITSLGDKIVEELHSIEEGDFSYNKNTAMMHAGMLHCAATALNMMLENEKEHMSKYIPPVKKKSLVEVSYK